MTGIGSLPFTDVEEAMRVVAEWSAEVPFWPQLPKVSEREAAIGQGLGLLGDLIEPRSEGYGYRVREGRIDAVVKALHRSDGDLTHASGFEAFLTAPFPQAVAVKGQIEGPITLAAYLFYRDKPFLADPLLFAAVAFHVSQTICWQVDRLKARGLPVLLFVDEPALCLDVDDQRLNALSVTLTDARARGAVAGLHCCAARPFERMCRVRPDILSFDAHEGLELFFGNEHALTFVSSGGTVAYGLVPTRKVENLDAKTIFTRWLAAASLAGDPRDLAQRAMVTATCGLGLVQPGSVAESFELARQVGALIQAHS